MSIQYMVSCMYHKFIYIYIYTTTPGRQGWTFIVRNVNTLVKSVALANIHFCSNKWFIIIKRKYKFCSIFKNKTKTATKKQIKLSNKYVDYPLQIDCNFFLKIMLLLVWISQWSGEEKIIYFSLFFFVNWICSSIIC